MSNRMNFVYTLIKVVINHAAVEEIKLSLQALCRDVVDAAAAATVLSVHFPRQSFNML